MTTKVIPIRSPGPLQDALPELDPEEEIYELKYEIFQLKCKLKRQEYLKDTILEAHAILDAQLTLLDVPLEYRDEEDDAS